MQQQDEKLFLIFNTTCIGDVLVTNVLVQNIKHFYPKSKVVFICNKPYIDVAAYQCGVDDVVAFDKLKNNSLVGIFNFIKNFPYKKPFAAFVTYSNERNLLISRLIGAKHIISHHKYKFWNTKERYPLPKYTHMKDVWGSLIEPLVGQHLNLPIKYCPPKINSPVINKVKTIQRPVVLCTTSNFCKKDMHVNDCKKLIELLNQRGYTPLLTGAGKVSENFAINLRKEGCFDFIDLVNCTSLPELAAILQISGKCITVDTGTLHLANALQVPVVGIFYAGCEYMWGSDETLYPAKILSGQVTPDEIMSTFNQFNGG